MRVAGAVAKGSEKAFNGSTMGALPKRYFTQEEYALLEEKAAYKSQYVAGEIFPMGEAVTGDVTAMGGAQPWHVRVTNNLGGMLYTRFRGRPCEYYTADMRVRIKAGELWTYPDVAALCGEPKYDKSQSPYSLLNPQVIFEVLSPSTEQFDRGDKFLRYRKLEMLTDYVLVSSARMRVEHYTRQADGSWIYRHCERPADVLSLASVNVEMPLAEIYERVQFPEKGFGE